MNITDIFTILKMTDTPTLTGMLRGPLVLTALRETEVTTVLHLVQKASSH